MSDEIQTQLPDYANVLAFTAAERAEMIEVHARRLLDELSEKKAALAQLELEKETKRQTILLTIAEELEAVEREYSDSLEYGRELVAGLEEQIKALVTQHGATVKGSSIMAVYSKGRESWDGKLLAGFALAHPEILKAQTFGQPSVSLRAVK